MQFYPFSFQDWRVAYNQSTSFWGSWWKKWISVDAIDLSYSIGIFSFWMLFLLICCKKLLYHWCVCFVLLCMCCAFDIQLDFVRSLLPSFGTLKRCNCLWKITIQWQVQNNDSFNHCQWHQYSTSVWISNGNRLESFLAIGMRLILWLAETLLCFWSYCTFKRAVWRNVSIFQNTNANAKLTLGLDSSTEDCNIIVKYLKLKDLNR